jgi:hypothetical protein
MKMWCRRGKGDEGITIAVWRQKIDSGQWLLWSDLWAIKKMAGSSAGKISLPSHWCARALAH